MIDISFVESGDDNSRELLSLKLESQPFKIGDKINLSLVNRDRSKWDVEGFDLIDYRIVEIESLVKISYSSNVSQFVYFEIKIEKP